MDNDNPTQDQAPERIRSLIQLQHDLRTKRDEALNELDFEDYSKLTNEMECLRDKQIELLVGEIAALRSPASAPVSIDKTPVQLVKETQQQLRKKFSMIFAEIWTTSPKIFRESAQAEIDLTFKTDRAVNHTAAKLGYLPKFPTKNKAAMEREAMDILTAFRIELEEDLIPTMAEAKADLNEYLMSMTETLLMDMDPAAGERD